MNIRLLEYKDYETLVSWWGFWRFPAPSRDFLPNDGIGGAMIYDDNGTEYCSAYLYTTNSKAAWIEFVVSNPNVRDKNLRKESLTFLINSLSDLARNNGFKYIYTSLKNDNLISKYKECGFIEGSKNCLELIKIL